MPNPRSQLELYGIGEAEQIPGFSDPGDAPLRDPVPFLDRDQRVFNGTVVAIERLVPGDQLLWISAGESTSSRVFEMSDWCQLVGRTWDPSLLQDRHPPLWNFMNRDPALRMAHHARERIETLSAPRSWASGRSEMPSDIRRKILSQEDWLGQLQ